MALQKMCEMGEVVSTYSSDTKSVATGQFSTNFRAETCALLHAAQILNGRDDPFSHTVFLTDCRALLQSLQSTQIDKILQDTRRELQTLGSKTKLVLQWIPSHCGVMANEKVDRLSKLDSKQEQTAQQMSYGKVKTLLKKHFKNMWRQRLHGIYQLNRSQQVIIFRLRTGHCQLLSHLFRLKIPHTDECPCGIGPQTPAHIIQSCPTFDTLRQQTWPSAVDLREKLWGPATLLRLTADFVHNTGLPI
ncbi:uncharacterized protein LOC121373011 [Gigantopelta aegis]|uniref:uncharacterized protein LOC121373011 n=1 Tax=Gigantopelta aegis TaxID=1735272 RepID=UPI001B889709|nr:uncharacterized protein LOC121373011 [Gigantopelta aegis]